MDYPPYPNAAGGGPPLLPRRPLQGPAVVAIVLGSVAAVVGLGLLALFIAFAYVYGENHAGMRFPSDDVTVASCVRDEVTGRPAASIRITSGAARSGTYTVRVAFRDAGTGQGRGTAAGESGVTVADLAAGGTVSRQVAGPVPVRGAPVCELGDVTFESTREAGSGATSAR